MSRHFVCAWKQPVPGSAGQRAHPPPFSLCKTGQNQRRHSKTASIWTNSFVNCYLSWSLLCVRWARSPPTCWPPALGIYTCCLQHKINSQASTPPPHGITAHAWGLICVPLFPNGQPAKLNICTVQYFTGLLFVRTCRVCLRHTSLIYQRFQKILRNTQQHAIEKAQKIGINP